MRRLAGRRLYGLRNGDESHAERGIGRHQREVPRSEAVSLAVSARPLPPPASSSSSPSSLRGWSRWTLASGKEPVSRSRLSVTEGASTFTHALSSSGVAGGITAACHRSVRTLTGLGYWEECRPVKKHPHLRTRRQMLHGFDWAGPHDSARGTDHLRTITPEVLSTCGAGHRLIASSSAGSVGRRAFAGSASRAADGPADAAIGQCKRCRADSN